MSEPSSPAANAAQIDYWNTTAGQIWATHQEQLDRQIEPLGLEAIRALAPSAGERIIDIGCGCGQTTVARARGVPAGAATPDFREVDAQTADLGAGLFDAVFSRFGVMFFSDPVAAFGNLRKALKPGGRLSFVCWRAFQDNLWMRAPMAAALPLLPPSAPMDPLAPGPFAFADPDRVRTILADAGFTDVRLAAFDTLIGGSSIDQTVDLAFRVGPLGAALRENPDRAADVAGAVRQAIAPYDTPGGVLMPAAVWIVQAASPA